MATTKRTTAFSAKTALRTSVPRTPSAGAAAGGSDLTSSTLSDLTERVRSMASEVKAMREQLEEIWAPLQTGQSNTRPTTPATRGSTDSPRKSKKKS